MLESSIPTNEAINDKLRVDRLKMIYLQLFWVSYFADNLESYFAKKKIVMLLNSLYDGTDILPVDNLGRSVLNK